MEKIEVFIEKGNKILKYTGKAELNSGRVLRSYGDTIKDCMLDMIDNYEETIMADTGELADEIHFKYYLVENE